MSALPPLPRQPPRHYRLRDAWRRRIWRDRSALLCRDLSLLGIAVAMAGVAYAESAFIVLGAAVALGASLLGQLATLLANRWRVDLIRGGPTAQARLNGPRAVYLLGELFRGAGSRTYTLRYTYELPDGEIRDGKMLVCGCARHALQAGGVEAVLYDPARPGRSLPLRAAMMVRPR